MPSMFSPEWWVLVGLVMIFISAALHLWWWRRHRRRAQPFLSPDEIAADVYASVTDADRLQLLLIPGAEGMIRYHDTVGRDIRNNYKLWDPNNPYTRIDCEPNSEGIVDDPLHPDQVSHEILKKVWNMVRLETNTERG